eukprot:3168919-Rhodomonas_salina.2
MQLLAFDFGVQLATHQVARGCLAAPASAAARADHPQSRRERIPGAGLARSAWYNRYAVVGQYQAWHTETSTTERCRSVPGMAYPSRRLVGCAPFVVRLLDARPLAGEIVNHLGVPLHTRVIVRHIRPLRRLPELAPHPSRVSDLAVVPADELHARAVAAAREVVREVGEEARGEEGRDDANWRHPPPAARKGQGGHVPPDVAVTSQQHGVTSRMWRSRHNQYKVCPACVRIWGGSRTGTSPRAPYPRATAALAARSRTPRGARA